MRESFWEISVDSADLVRKMLSEWKTLESAQSLYNWASGDEDKESLAGMYKAGSGLGLGLGSAGVDPTHV